jgi:hypothetical protein
VYEGNVTREFVLFSAGAMGPVEVRVDGEILPGMLEAFYKKYRGKKIEVHLKPGGDPSADIGYLPI